MQAHYSHLRWVGEIVKREHDKSGNWARGCGVKEFVPSATRAEGRERAKSFDENDLQRYTLAWIPALRWNKKVDDGSREIDRGRMKW